MTSNTTGDLTFRVNHSIGHSMAELDSELVGGWHVDEGRLAWRPPIVVTLLGIGLDLSRVGTADDKIGFVSSILRDELDRIAPMPKTYDQAVLTLLPRLRWTSDVEFQCSQWTLS